MTKRCPPSTFPGLTGTSREPHNSIVRASVHWAVQDGNKRSIWILDIDLDHRRGRLSSANEKGDKQILQEAQFDPDLIEVSFGLRDSVSLKVPGILTLVWSNDLASVYARSPWVVAKPGCLELIAAELDQVGQYTQSD